MSQGPKPASGHVIAAELLASGDYLRLVIDTALDAVITMDADDIVLDWNSQAERTFGWSREEAVGKRLSSLIIPERYRDAHHKGLEHFLATGEGPVLNQRIEVSALRSDGHELPVELAITPAKLGERTVFNAFLRDITERRRTEQKLARQALEAGLLYRATNLAAETSSVEEALAGCVEAVCQMTGWPVGHAFLLSRSPEGDELVSTAVWHIAEGRDFHHLREQTEQTRFLRGTGLPGRILESGEPQWVPNVYADPTFVRAKASPSLGIVGAFGFPVKSRGEVAAVLEFFTEEARAPDPDLLLMARSIGEQVGRVFDRRRAEEHQKLLIRELNHRVKNTLNVVMAIASQTMRTSPTAEQFLENFQGRVRALGHAHALLTEQNWQSAELKALIESVLAPYRPRGDNQAAEITGPQLPISPEAALALSMVLHEMATNAAKYGALSAPGGKLAIDWHLAQPETGEQLILHWVESGLANIGEGGTRGFGTRLIDRSVTNDLDGVIERDFAPDGLRCRMVFPWESLRAGKQR